MSETISMRPVAATGRLGRSRRVGVVAFAAGVASTAWGTFNGSNIAEQLRSFAILTASIAVAAGVIFTFVVGRSLRKGETAHSARSGVITGAVGVLTVLVFWSGLPILLGSAALLLGSEARRAAAGASGRRTAITAMVLGLLALAGAVLAIVTDQLT